MPTGKGHVCAALCLQRVMFCVHFRPFMCQKREAVNFMVRSVVSLTTAEVINAASEATSVTQSIVAKMVHRWHQ